MPSPVGAVQQLVRSLPGVRSVALAGSRRAGDPTLLSDWDFHVAVDDDELVDALADQLEGFPTLAVFWDPLSTRATLIVLLEGPIKIDLIVSGTANPHPVPRWDVHPGSLARIDVHFWDWILWLGSKQLRADHDLVRQELDKMWHALLQPIGVARPVTSLAGTVEAYVAARDRQEHRFGVNLDHRLERQVRAALTRNRVITTTDAHNDGPDDEERRVDLSTSLELLDDLVAHFIVNTDNNLYQERLIHMGFRRVDASSFSRDLSATPDIKRIHERFSRHLEEVVLQSARLRPVPWDEALREFLRRVEGSGLDWFLSGSGALAVRGLHVSPGDLDFWVEDAQAIGRLLDDLLVEPVSERSGWIAKWFGRAFHGALIEWLADVDPAVDKKPNEQGPAAASRLETVDWEGHRIWVTPIDIQLEVSELRGLDSRMAQIRSWLQTPSH